MKAKELKDMPFNELKDLLIGESDKLTSLRLNHSVSPLENPQQIKFVKKNIARIKTEINLREINKNINDD